MKKEAIIKYIQKCVKEYKNGNSNIESYDKDPDECRHNKYVPSEFIKSERKNKGEKEMRLNYVNICKDCGSDISHLSLVKNN